MPDEYAAPVIRELRQALRANHVPADVQRAATRAIRFLERRLTDAAKAGCHHCHEKGNGEAGSPCWWCGLKNRGR